MAKVKIDDQSHFDHKLKEFIGKLRDINEEVQDRRFHSKDAEKKRQREKERKLKIKIHNKYN